MHILKDGAREVGTAPFPAHWPRRNVSRFALLIFLVSAAGLRFMLAWNGGQYFWPDEARFDRSRILLRHIGDGELAHAAGILTQADHPLFTVVAIPPLLAQSALDKLGLPRGSPRNPMWAAGAVLSLASVVNIALVFLVARRTGAGELEASIAAFLMAASNTMFYYSVHLVPYQVSLTANLLVLLHCLRATMTRAEAVATGLGLGLAFLIYAGNWALIATIASLYLAQRPISLRVSLRQMSLVVFGAILPFVALAALAFRLGQNFFSRIVSFASMSKSAEFDYTEGWIVPFAFFWHAEQALFVILLVGSALALLAYSTRRDRSIRGILWPGATATFYLFLTLASDVFHEKPVCARFVSACVPFLALSTAHAAELVWRRRGVPRALLLTTGFLVIVQAAFNFRGPLTLSYPNEVKADVISAFGAVDEAFTVEGPPVESENHQRRYLLLNAGYLHPIVGTKIVPEGLLVFKVDHPLSYPPFQYECFPPPSRQILRSHDISIRLIDRFATAPGHSE